MCWSPSGVAACRSRSWELQIRCQSLSCSSRFSNFDLILLHNFFFMFTMFFTFPTPHHHHHHHCSMRDQDDRTRVLYHLFSMISNILGSPPLPIPFPTTISGSSSSFAPSPQVSPAGFAALFIGISFALMLFGSAIFVIGFMLMPLVIALVMLFYLAVIVSNLTYLARALLLQSSRIVSGHLPFKIHH